MDKEKLIARRAELVQRVEAIDEVIRSKGWQVLRKEFEGRESVLERQLIVEAKKSPVEVEKIYFLQGELAENKRFDLPHWQEKIKKELEGIKLNLT